MVAMAEAATVETIRLAFVDTEAPPVYHRSDPDTGARRGYEPEAAALICAAAGLQIEWVPLPWDEMIPAVRRGEVDAVWCGQGVIPERAALVDFTVPYAAFRDALVLRAEHAGRGPGSLSGLRIAVIAGSANLQFLRGFDGVTAVEFGSSDDVLGDMMDSARRGETDGFVDDDAVMAPFASGDPDFVLAVVGEVLHPWAGVAPGNDTLRLRLNAARDAVVADGRLAAIWRAWMPEIPFPFAEDAVEPEPEPEPAASLRSALSQGSASSTLFDAPALWNAQAHMPRVLGHQLEIVRGEGEYVFTRDGRRLFDAPAGLWYANVGHGRLELAEAAYTQMQRLETFHLFGRFTNDRATGLAERLAGLSPIPEPKVILTSGGSDSIDLSAKLARRYWQAVGQSERTVILSRDGGYHGLHAYGTSIVGIEANREGLGTASLVPDTGRVDRDDITAVAREIERIGGDRVAALVLEPVIGAGGVYPPTPGYLDGMRELADRHGFLLIADEVVTGFGRVGEWFASTRFGFAPDIIAFAKGVTSGYRRSAACSSRRGWPRPSTPASMRRSFGTGSPIRATRRPQRWPSRTSS